MQNQKSMSQFSIVFALKDLGTLSYFHGIEGLYDRDCIYLSQRNYIRDLLANVDTLECKRMDTPPSELKKKKNKAILAITLKIQLFVEALLEVYNIWY